MAVLDVRELGFFFVLRSGGGAMQNSIRISVAGSF